MDEKKKKDFTIINHTVKNTQVEVKSEYKKGSYQKFKSYVSSFNISSFFGSVVLILISAMLIRFLYTGTPNTLTLRGLLELFKNAPQVSTSIKNFFGSINLVGDWGFFEFLRYFLNIFTQFFGIITWISSSLFDVIIFIVYFLTWLFI